MHQSRNRLLPALLTVLAVLTAPEMLLAAQGNKAAQDVMGRMLERLRFTTTDIQATLSEEELFATVISQAEQLLQQPEHHPAHSNALAAFFTPRKRFATPCTAPETPYVAPHAAPALTAATRIRAPAC